MASIIENEVNQEEYRAKVARVIYNRLAKDMKLAARLDRHLRREPEDEHHHSRRTGKAGRRTTPTATRACHRGRSPRRARPRCRRRRSPRRASGCTSSPSTSTPARRSSPTPTAEYEQDRRRVPGRCQANPGSVQLTGARRCAVLGSPIGHSLSPRLHRAAYAAWVWTGRTSGSRSPPPDSPISWPAGPRWRGLSLTMPLKEAVLGLGEVDPVARLAGRGNTLILGGAAPGLQHRRGRAGLGGPPGDARPGCAGHHPRLRGHGPFGAGRRAEPAGHRDGHRPRPNPGQGRDPGRPRHRAGPADARSSPGDRRPPPADLVVSTPPRARPTRWPTQLAASAPWSSTSSTPPGLPRWPRPRRGPAGR